ncbi:MAG: PHP domain-containing protein [Chloroflexota bacterium]|nr:PHP domain-containing protein [Chloroflexota bacterium]
MAEPGAARADLHTHSTASDGTLAPADLVRQASRRGLTILALTDHDTTGGLAEAIATGEELGIRVIPGIELSTDVSAGEVHMLGYGIDPGSESLQSALARYRQARLERAERIISRLRDLGVDLPEGSVQASASDAALGRPHIARAMIAAGYVQTVSEAFDRFLGNDKPAYIASERKPTPAEAIALIRAAGGLPVHAHPCTSDDFPGSLAALIEAGLAAIEVYYAEYTPDRRETLARVAASYGLLATGGSDYHGEQFKERRELGSVNLPADVLQRFLQRLDD